MVSLMIDTDDLAVAVDPRFAGMRVATYADIVTPEIVSVLAGRLVAIDRGLGDPHGLATVADIEPGALSVESGAAAVRQWVQEKRPHPTAYHDRVDWAAVNEALAGVAYSHWVACLDGTLVPSGLYMAVVQFAPERVLGFHADMSIVWDERWNPLPAAPDAAALAATRQLAGVVAQGVAQLVHELAVL